MNVEISKQTKTKQQSRKLNTTKSPMEKFNICKPDPAEDQLIFFTTKPREAFQLLQSEAEKLLEEGWEVMQVSKRSYIAVLDGCEIYLHTCSKGLSARIFQFDETVDRL